MNYPIDAYQEALNTSNPDTIRSLQKRIVSSGNGQLAYLFARDIPGANIAALRAVADADLNTTGSLLFAMSSMGEGGGGKAIFPNT